MKKYVVLQNYDLHLEDYEEFFQEEYPDFTESEKWDYIYEFNNDQYEIEKYRLDIDLSDHIIKVGTVERWDGIYYYCESINSSNVSDCLQFEKDCDYAEFFVTQYGNFYTRQSHHDGNVFLEYRVLRHNLTDEQKDHFLDIIEWKKVSNRTIRRYTESIGKHVADVYGWKVRG